MATSDPVPPPTAPPPDDLAPPPSATPSQDEDPALPRSASLHSLHDLDEDQPETETKEEEVVGGASAATPPGEEEEDAQNAFECNICLDVARDAVISVCGHLFCWPCLHQWLETRPNRQICPVCKAGISRDKVIPLYGRGNTDQKDPRDKVPPRPRGQRPEPENNGGNGGGFFSPFNMGNQAGGLQMSFGIGAFPFGFFATNFNLGDANAVGGGGARANAPAPGSQQYQEEQFLHQVFLWVALMFIVWLFLA